MTGTTRKIDQSTLAKDDAVRFFYLNLSEISWMQMLFPVVICWIFYDVIEHTVLFTWLFLTLSVYMGRIILIRQYLKASPPPEEASRWGFYLSITTFISGSLWGYAAFSFHDPDQLYNEVMIYVIVIGFSVGSLILTTYWLPAFYAFAIPSLGGVLLGQIVHEHPHSNLMAFLILVFLLMQLKVAARSNRVAHDAIRLAHKNIELIQKLEEEKEKAEAANHAKTRFLASANHDLRQPVHALSLLVHGLKKELTSAQGKLLFLRLERSVENLGNLLESLLDLSRLDASAVQVHPRQFPLSSIASQMLTEFLPVAREKGLRFSVRPSDKFLYTDKTLLERLLRNLLHNAFRYTHSGGVLLGFRNRGDHIVIEVWDTGIGISAQEKDKIFSEFYQSENAERDRSKGLGLGLSICQRISELLGTELTCESREGRGSVFRFSLPIDNVTRITSTTVEQPHQEADLQGKTLLVIDDDIEVLQAMIQLLKNRGIIPITARSSSEAFEALEANHIAPDAIICDHRLSDDENGLNVIRQIQLRYKAPALIITGDTAPDNLRALDESGFPVLHKPISPALLFETLDKLIVSKQKNIIKAPA